MRFIYKNKEITKEEAIELIKKSDDLLADDIKSRNKVEVNVSPRLEKIIKENHLTSPAGLRTIPPTEMTGLDSLAEK